MAAAGHQFFTPSYTGLGEREHLADPSNDLDTHIRDVLGVIDAEELNDFVLMGHSYGGMVATGVADRARDRISQLIYLDAFVPKNGQSLADLVPPEQGKRMKDRRSAGRWLARVRQIRHRAIRRRMMSPGCRSIAGRSRSNALSRN